MDLLEILNNEKWNINYITRDKVIGFWSVSCGKEQIAVGTTAANAIENAYFKQQLSIILSNNLSLKRNEDKYIITKGSIILAEGDTIDNAIESLINNI